jgi:subtilase family serine protease
MRVSYKLTLILSAVFLVAILTAGAFAGGFASFLAGQPAQYQTLTAVPGSVPIIIDNATAVGTPASTTDVTFSVFLPMRNQATFTSTLSSIYDKKSASYRHFMTPAQLASQFAPLQSDYQALQTYFTGNGLQITYSSSDRLIMGVTGSLSAVAAALGTTFTTFTKNGVTFFANSQPVQLPSALNVQAILGLTNYSLFQPMYASPAMVSSGNPSPNLVPTGNVGSTYYAQQLQEAYGATAIYSGGNIGNGTNIAIIDAFDAQYLAADLASYDSFSQLPAPPSLTVVYPTGVPNVGSGVSAASGQWYVETILDVEQAHALAPGAGIVLALSKDNGDSLYGAVDYIVSQGPTYASVVSQSFGIPEILLSPAVISAIDQIYKFAAMEGITCIASDGDWGAVNANFGLNFANANFPASDPWILGIGGTTAFFNRVSTILNGTLPFSTGGGRVFETAWSWSYRNNWGTGGGYSVVFAAPSWQTGLPSRGVPDVAAIGDPQTGVLLAATIPPSAPGYYVIGGTSVGSPEWAGMIALLNTALANNHLAPAGAVAPAIYALSPANKALDFYDVTVGNNQGDLYHAVTPLPLGYNASVGWDPLTGWGTPNLNHLIPDLVAAYGTPTLTAVPSSGQIGSMSVALNGFGFTPNGTVGLNFTFNGGSQNLIGNYTADTNGQFSASFGLSSPSGTWVFLAYDYAKAVTATVQFQALPILVANVTTVHEGSVFSLTGNYFNAAQNISIYSNVDGYSTTVLSNSTGGFNVDIPVGPTAPYTSLVTAQDPSGNLAKVLMQVQPFISLNVTSGSAGTPVRLTAVTFLSGTVSLRFGGNTLGTATANTFGEFTFNFIVPSVAQGLYTVSGTDGIGNVATATFNVTAPAGPHIIASAEASSFSYINAIPASSQAFATNSSGGTVHTLSMYLTGSGTATISLGTSAFGSQLFTTTLAVSGPGLYNVTVPSVALPASSTYYLSVSTLTGSIQWAFAYSWTYSLNVGLAYMYFGTTLFSTTTFSYIFTVG